MFTTLIPGMAPRLSALLARCGILVAHCESVAVPQCESVAMTDPTKDVLDENYLQVIGNVLRMCQELPDDERRVEVLKLFNLPADTTDADAEATLRSGIATSFEQPVDPALSERLVQMVLAAMRQPAVSPAS